MFTLEQEDEILDAFQPPTEVIVRDGAISHRDFTKQPRRVLFVLKEPNDPAQNWAGDYRKLEHQHVFQRGSTWPMITKIAALLTERLDLSLPYKEAHRLSQRDERLPILCRIAVINLKKCGGGARCERNLLVNYLTDNRRELLKKQIALYEPNIVLAGGDDVMAILKELYDVPSRRTYEPDGLHFFVHNGMPVMVIWHPNASSKTHAWLYEHYHKNFSTVLMG
jgi:hypothetical protein